MEKKSNHKIKNYKLEKFIIKTFLKYIKRENLYITFRLAVNHDHKKNDIIHSVIKACNGNAYRAKLDNMHNIGSEYAYAKSLEDIAEIMHNQISGWDYDVPENTKDFQMLVMNLVNSLLHNCIEYGVRNNMAILEKIGSKIYEECCKELLGDSFEDLTQQEANIPQIEEIVKFMKNDPRISLSKIEEIIKRYSDCINQPPQDIDQSKYVQYIDWDKPIFH